MHDDRPTLASPDDDPHLHLEDIESPSLLAWVETQNARTLEAFGGAGLEADAAALRAIHDRPERIPYVTRVSGRMHDVWTDERNSKGLWRRTTLGSWLSPDPEWTVLPDVDELAREEGEDWVLGGQSNPPRDERRALLMLSRGGSDACVMREFDALDGRFVADGFTVPEAKGAAAWLDADTLLLASVAGGDRFATDSGYARTVRRWRRGTPLEDADVLFETAKEHMAVWAAPDYRHRDAPVYVVERLDFFNTRTWLLSGDDAPRSFDMPADAWLAFDDDLMVVKPRTDASAGGVDWRADTLMVGSRDRFLAGEGAFETLFEPSERCALEWFTFVGGKILVHVEDHLRSRYDL